jgi:2,3-bisphosphoglycerate-dependent phosphoglycerate mutase
VQLTQAGVEEARQAGLILKEKGYKFDIAFSSVLTRAINTYNTVATELGCSWIPLHKSWRLNERHYGALTGLNKAETAAKHGEE